ncbi:MAG: hypothetical protein K2Q01_10525 [Rickettsiales bacterium]|nr:hypothetical protein [Rickettsiales bacterium]
MKQWAWVAAMTLAMMAQAPVRVQAQVAAPAAAAPATLCSVTGTVTNVLQQEMARVSGPEQGQKVMVPVVAVEVESAVPADAAYQGDFCARMVPPAPAGVKTLAYFRLCDAEAEFMTGQRVRGLAGNSQGGGLYCLAHISVVP